MFIPKLFQSFQRDVLCSFNKLVEAMYSALSRTYIVQIATCTRTVQSCAALCNKFHCFERGVLEPAPVEYRPLISLKNMRGRRWVKMFFLSLAQFSKLERNHWYQGKLIVQLHCDVKQILQIIVSSLIVSDLFHCATQDGTIIVPRWIMLVNNMNVSLSWKLVSKNSSYYWFLYHYLRYCFNEAPLKMHTIQLN